MLTTEAITFLNSKLAVLMAEDPGNKQAITILKGYLEKSPVENLFPLHVNELKSLTGLPSYTLTTLLLRAVRQGILELEWHTVCGSCGGVTHFTHDLEHTHESSTCSPCNLTFDVTVDENLEVEFSISENLVKRPVELARVTQKGGLKAADLMNNAFFRRHFSNQVVASDSGLKIKNITILFTDLKKSTELYEHVGDLNAFRLVRNHFDEMASIIEYNHGAIVKTIGDAVMAAFVSTEDGVQAAVDIQDHFRKQAGAQPLIIKMGVHNGPALVVNLNGRIDYFGSNVNIAARVQSLSKGGDVFISKSVFDDQRAQKKLKLMPAIFRYRARLKGIKDEYFVYQLNQRAARS